MQYFHSIKQTFLTHLSLNIYTGWRANSDSDYVHKLMSRFANIVCPKTKKPPKYYEAVSNWSFSFVPFKLTYILGLLCVYHQIKSY